MSVIGAQQDNPTPEQLNEDGQQETVTDLAERPASPAEAAEVQPKTEEPEKPKVHKIKVGGDFEDKRAAIGEKHEATKAERGEKFDDNFSDPRLTTDRTLPSEGDPAIDALEAEAARRAGKQPAADLNVQPQQLQQQQPAQPDQMVELKVNGVTKQVPLSDLIANAQKYEAGEDRLAEAKRILEETKRLRGDAPAPEANHSPAPGTSPVNAQSGQDQPKLEVTPDLKEIVRAIQMGDEEEAAQALLQFQRKAAAPHDPSTLATDVAQIVQLQAEQNSSAAAIENFRARNPEFQDPFARQIGTTMLLDEMRKDLAAAARARGFSDTQIAQLTSDDASVRLMHERARAMRAEGFRSIDTLLQTSRDAFHAWKGTPQQAQQPTAEPQNQFSRARSAAPQPAARSSAPALAKPQVRQTNAEIVAEMRQGRMAR